MIGKIQDVLAGSIAIGIGQNGGASTTPEVKGAGQATADAAQTHLPQNPAAVSSIGGQEQASKTDELDAAIDQALDPQNKKMPSKLSAV